MDRLPARRARRALLLSCVVLVAGCTSTALATTASYDGDTLVITGGDSADHDLQFRLSADAVRDEIIDTQEFTSIPGDCTVVVANTRISCPAHAKVQLGLGAGSDEVTFGGSNADCFSAYTLNLGDGVNRLNLHDNCAPPQTATVNSGSGPDQLTGGNQSTITFNAGGGDDSVSGGSGDNVIHGGEGNDRLFGEDGNDQVFGEGGNDAMKGGAGNDRVDGGDGDDGLELCSQCAVSNNDPGVGADTYSGGLGFDKLWLDYHAAGVSISLDGAANDGTPGEGDDIGADIEAVEGTTGNDAFTGSADPNVFSGNSGNDEMHGAGGADDLYGGGGDDKLFGEAGDDRVQGGPFADTVDGGAGADQLYGDIAGCSVFCSVDPDTLLARDGEKDTVDCGGGADSAVVDFDDVVAFCASVDRAPGPPGPPPGPPPPPVVCGNCGNPVFNFPTFSAATLGKLGISKPLSVVVRCSAACQYRVTIVLSARLARRYGLGKKAITIGSASGKLKAAGKTTRRMTLTAAARRKFRRAASVAATLRMTLTQGGRTTSRSKGVTLRR